MNPRILIVVIIGTMVNVFIVWKLYSSRQWRYIKLYRFFSLEAILLLCVFNFPVIFSARNFSIALPACLILVISLFFFLSAIISSRLLTSDVQFPTKGIYAHIRYPIEAGMFWLSVGLFLLQIDGTSLILVVLSCYALYEIIKQKEEILLKNFGGDFAVYAKKTKRIIPFLY
ncbi:MAG: hypothetical protein KBG83_06700 [Bacteroidetes bacterium]|nr:hypothetical protein [Bacteroidota bacterium]